MTSECDVCGNSINTLTDAHYWQISGWQRKGSSAIKNGIKSGHVCCVTCMDGNGQIEGQEELF